MAHHEPSWVEIPFPHRQPTLLRLQMDLWQPHETVILLQALCRLDTRNDGWPFMQGMRRQTFAETALLASRHSPLDSL